MLRQFPASAFSVITHTPLSTREGANSQIGRLVGYAHGGNAHEMGWECPEGYERYFSPIMFAENYPPAENGNYRVEIWIPIRKIEQPESYNALERFVSMRREVVSDLPKDIHLEALTLSEAEKQWITAGLPLARDCIRRIYDSVEAYARENLDEMKTAQILSEKGGAMKLNREAQKHLDTTFATLFFVLSQGIYDGETACLTIEKAALRDMPRQLEKKYVFKPVYLEHFAHFCRVEYWRGKMLSDWRHADTVRLAFEDHPLAYTLLYMVRHGVTPLHFPYGDFRLFSAAGQLEEKNRFPQSLYRKALGEEKYRLFCRLKERMNAVLGDMICFEKENWYQGDGRFRLIEHYALHTKKFGYLELIVYKEQLLASVHFDKTYFENLPAIIEDLSPKFRDIIFHLPKCLEKGSLRCTVQGALQRLPDGCV